MTHNGCLIKMFGGSTTTVKSSDTFYEEKVFIKHITYLSVLVRTTLHITIISLRIERHYYE